MHLSRATVNKFIRETLVTTPALVVDETLVADLKERLGTWFAGVEEMGMVWLGGAKSIWAGLTHELCRFGLKVPSRSIALQSAVSLGRDARRKLRLSSGITCAHPVGSLDELFAFLRRFQERALRIHGQQARRTKVRNLRSAAIHARVQELARTYRFDYSTSETEMQMDLALRFDGDSLIALVIPLAQPDEVLLQLEAALPHFRDLAHVGIAATLRPKKNYSSSAKWVLHQTLAQDEAIDSLPGE
jgi:hypothetical protein